MRQSVILALAALAGAAGVQAEVTAESAKYSFPDHKTRPITLSYKGGGGDLVYRVTRNVYPWAGSPHATDGEGTIDVPAGYVAGSALPIDFERVSKMLYTQRGGAYGARALEKIDIYPRYGDHPGSWMSQTGDNNFVKLEFPRVRRATALRIYETFNPGGVFRVKVHSRHGETMSVFTEGAPNFSRKTEHNGASVMTVHFEPVHFDIVYVTVYVDASKKWRGIDAIELVGERRERAEVPGDMFGNKLNFVPNPEKPYGCDAFSFAVHDGKGGEWSNRANVKVCYGCPKNPVSGQVCSGAGKCHMAECICEVGFKGDACEISQCPRSDGQICGGKGTCEAGVCQCFKEWAGRACETRRHVARCATCNDPHYTTFDNSRFSYYESGESLAFEWRQGPGPKLIVAQHLRPCGSRAYRQSWSPISCVDGASIRYGDDVVTWKYTNYGGKAAGNYINCKKTATTNTWQNIGTNGMQVYFGRNFQVKIGDTFHFTSTSGCFNLVTSIPRTKANSNEIVGMCGNYDGIARNDAGGALSWDDVPRFPTDNSNPMPSSSYAQVKRERAIAWGKFFQPKPGCDLFSCKKCSSYLNYNAFPIRYDGKIDQLAEAHKIETQLEDIDRVKGINQEKLVRKDIHDPAKNAHLVTLVSSLSRTATETGELKDGRVGMDGDEVPADFKLDSLPDHIVGAPYAILYKAMSMKTCLQFIGKPEFDSCVWDAIALHSKAGGGLPIDQAITKATEINITRLQAKKDADKDKADMKEALDHDEETEEANNQG